MKNIKKILVSGLLIGSMVFGVVGCSDVKSTKDADKENNTKKEQQVVKLNEKEDYAVHMLMQNLTAYSFGSITRSFYINYIEHDVKETLKGDPREKYIEINDKIRYGDFEESIRASVYMINKFAGSKRISLDDLKIKKELKEEESDINTNDSNKTAKEYKCPICGGDCPEDSECLKYSPGTCAACNKPGTVNKDLVEWTNNHGEHMTTHKGHCTDIMKEEDEMHTVKTFHCDICGRAVQCTPAEWTGTCEYCEMNKEANPNEVKCPNCGSLLAPNGKCADCGYGY